MGLDWTTNPLALEKQALLDAKNCNLNKFKGIDKRKGVSLFDSNAADASANVISLYEYKAPNGTNYVIEGGSTAVKRSTGSGWSTLKSGLTNNKKISFATHQGSMIGVNGTDDNWKVYNTSAYAVGITPPSSAPSISNTNQAYALNEDCDSFASPYTWADNDAVNGASTTETEDAKTAFRFYNSAGAGGSLARRGTTLATQLGSRFTFEFVV